MATTEDIIEAFPGVAPLLRIAEIRSIFNTALAEGWTFQRAEAEIFSTAWYQNSTAQAREWSVLGSGEKEARIKTWASQIVAEYDRMFGSAFIKDWDGSNPSKAGFYSNIGNAHIRDLAFRVAAGKVPWEYLQYLIRQEALKRPDTEFAIQEGERQAQLKRLKQRPEEIAEEFWNRGRREYRVPISEATALSWATKINDGTASEHDFNDYLRERAATLYGPKFAERIMAGMLPSELLDDYTSVAARLLERSADDVYFDPNSMNDLLHPLLRADKELPTLIEYANYIRSLPAWDATQNARQEALGLVRAFGQRFGTVV